jgi:hypothetical protein
MKNIMRSLQTNLAAIGLCIAAVSMSSSVMASPIYAVIDTSDVPLQKAGVVRGNVPFPKGLLFANETVDKFGFIDSDGSTKRAQTNVVTRHPDGSIAIAELVAAVQGTASQGETLGRYKVTSLATPAPKKGLTNTLLIDLGALSQLAPEAQSFLEKKSLWVQATGPFAEKYACNLLNVPQSNVKIYKLGYIENTISVACDLKPINGFNLSNKKEIPQILSVIGFLTFTTGDPVMKLDLLYGNTRVGFGAYTGNTYFRDLKLAVPAENILVNDVPVPSYDPKPILAGGLAIYNVVKARADGTQYVAPEGVWHSRRLAITTPANTARATAELSLQGQGFAVKASFNGVETFSWQNPLTSNFGLGEAIPDLSFIKSQDIKDKWNMQWINIKLSLQDGLKTGSFENGVLGDSQPWLGPYGGMTGGTEVDMISKGASGITAASASSVRWYHYVLGAYLDREMGKFSTQANGEPWTLDSVLTKCTASGNPTGLAQKAQFSAGDGLPINLSQDDPFGVKAASIYDYHRIAAKPPAYEITLLSYKAIDFQHGVRVNNNLYDLINLTNDSTAKYIIRGLAENTRASLTMFAKNNGNCATLNDSLLVAYQHAISTPGIGAPIGRAEADAMHLITESYASGDNAWRNNIRYWLNAAADTMVQGQVQCSGKIMAKALPNGKGYLDVTYNTSDNYIQQSIESSRLSQAAEIMINKVFNGYDAVRATNLRSAQNRYIAGLIEPAFLDSTYDIPKQTLVYNSTTKQVVCPNNVKPEMLFFNGDNYEAPNDLLRGYDRTLNGSYLTVANANMSSATTVLKDLQNKFTTSIGKEYYWDAWSATALQLAQKNKVQ